MLLDVGMWTNRAGVHTVRPIMADHDPEPAAPNVDKSPTKSLYGVAADPSLRGTGPEPGAPNAGRPPNAFRAECLRLQRDVGLVKVREYLADEKNSPESPAWQWCLAYLSKYGEKETAKVREHIHDATPTMLEGMLRAASEARQRTAQETSAQDDDA